MFKPDIFAGYEIDFLPKKSPLFQFEIDFSGIRIFLTPQGRGAETSVFVENPILVDYYF